jgi:hypothetical protein
MLETLYFFKCNNYRRLLSIEAEKMASKILLQQSLGKNMRCAPGSARGSVDQAEAEEGGHKMNLHV